MSMNILCLIRSLIQKPKNADTDPYYWYKDGLFIINLLVSMGTLIGVFLTYVFFKKFKEHSYRCEVKKRNFDADMQDAH